MNEMGLGDTHGILARPGVRPLRTSAGLGWERLYVSTQRELPYREAFQGAGSHLVILHLDGPVTVRRGRRGLTAARQVPPGGLFLHPADTELDVELGGYLNTVHVYLSDAALQATAETAKDGRPVRLREEFGTTDPLLEQLVLALDGVVRHWEPSGRTYADQLALMTAAQLARRHSVRPGTPPAGGWRSVAEPDREQAGLSDRQFTAVRELMDTRLSEPLSLEDLASAAGLGVSQFTRRFRARTGCPPHRYLVRLRVERATRLLRAGSMPIAQVAAACGFSHQEHLTRVIRSRLGTTPAALRREG
ncbi:AraC family transcriptional regulator [Streptomyces humidus]|uniref:AraC family transcriptional regulator n=1 Tax=Streptomyces humidus TaxID=52259 RepID=A0A918L2E2_9ACTN|nr:helix-turn-helix domain-containing protein [Streptomyces humidus]GGR76904.1 AraC family transcriptional regulator [Streptomyces humidus]